MDITLKNLGHLYQAGTPFEQVALKNINLSVTSGTFLSVIGHTGSGKSTLIQHLNGLLKPTSGEITIGDVTIKANQKKAKLKALRRRVGMVFQYPEHQLFEETIEKDICFGPMNFGSTLDEAKKKARVALEMVGLPETFLQRSPFDLSGGQMRRVAIAGVLAIEPEVLILDEPTAGLDPRGRYEMMELFYRLHQERHLTTILVTHSMEDAATYSDEILIMDHGEVFDKGTPKQIFKNVEALRKLGLDVPETIKFLLKLEERLSQKFDQYDFSIPEAAAQIAELFGKGMTRK